MTVTFELGRDPSRRRQREHRVAVALRAARGGAPARRHRAQAVAELTLVANLFSPDESRDSLFLSTSR